MDCCRITAEPSADATDMPDVAPASAPAAAVDATRRPLASNALQAAVVSAGGFRPSGDHAVALIPSATAVGAQPDAS